MIYRRLARPALFRLGGGDAETAHDVALNALARVAGHPAAVRALSLLVRAGGGGPRTVFGVRFPGPVGLAAGMDKDGSALAAWPALGFGFVEVGTVTAHAQLGNDPPRLFRLPQSRAVVNRMGFNNAGAAALAARLDSAGPLPVPLGISLGKSKVAPLEEAVDDYLASLKALGGHGDYLAVNVSSPNTPGLRRLQDASALAELLGALRAELGPGGRPLLVKVAPDLSDAALAELVAVCLDLGVAGVIATNTTVSRDGLTAADAAAAAAIGAGGLSGAPLFARALEVVGFVHREAGGALPIIGVGGISSADDAARMVDAGASLVQFCTGLIYQGPALVRAVNRRLAPTPFSAI